MKFFAKFAACLLACAALCACAPAPKKKISVVSGGSVHYWGDHENEIMGELVSGMLREALAGKADVKLSLIHI